jgi:hypothetical protein
MKSDIYLHRGLTSVEGWLDPFGARFIAALSSIHRKVGISGSVGEIGVHHGKLFALLHADAERDRKSFAVDLFEEQHLNIDRSGKGNYAKFVQNVEKWAGPISAVEIIKGSSLDIKPQDLLEKVGGVRLFSVDGGHTEECTINDICLAEGVLVPKGVVVLDDVFNPHWPDVVTGFAKYSLLKDARLRPFAITPNKVYLTQDNATEFWRQEVSAAFSAFWNKESKLFGSRVDIYGIYELDKSLKQRTKRALEYMHLFKPLDALRTKLLSR